MNKFYNCVSKIHQLFLDYIYKKRINNIKLKKQYKIIPLGTFCFSRVITTCNGLKPSKSQGELTCPFDIAFFTKLAKIAELIKTQFVTFFDDTVFNEEKQYYENLDLGAIFNHDGKLSKSEFEEKYRNRINNFYNYLADKTTHKYFLIATRRMIKYSDIDSLFEAINVFCNKDNFNIILINQSPKNIASYENKLYSKNFYLINDAENYKTFQEINKNNNWVGELKKRNSTGARKIYNACTRNLIKILSK